MGCAAASRPRAPRHVLPATELLLPLTTAGMSSGLRLAKT